MEYITTFFLFLQESIGNIGFYVLLFLTGVLIVLLFVEQLVKGQKRSSLLTSVEIFKGKSNKTKTNRVVKDGPFTKLKKQIHLMHYMKENEKREQIIFVSILVAEGLTLIIMAVFHKYILAIVFPLLLHWIIKKAIDLKTLTIHDFIQKDLPVAIKHIIKVMTKTSDLKTVFYEASKGMKDPIRGRFFDMSRKMITENHEKVLMDFADEIGNTWTYAFSFIMTSYKESSKKEDIIKNLALLGDILERENYNAEKSITEKKSVALMNYLLIVGAVAGFVVNLMFNDHAMEFFFNSVGGVMCMMIGFLSIGATVLINLMLMRKSY